MYYEIHSGNWRFETESSWVKLVGSEQLLMLGIVLTILGSSLP